MQRGGGDADPGCMVTVVAKDDAKLELQNKDADLRKDDLRKKDSAARSRSPRREGSLGRAVTPLEIRRKRAALALAQAQAALLDGQWKVREMDREAPSDAGGAPSDAGGAMTEERQPNQEQQIPDEPEDQWPWVNWVEINTGGDMERCFVKAGTKMWADWRGHQWYRVAQQGQRMSEWHDCGPHVVGQRVTSTPTES